MEVLLSMSEIYILDMIPMAAYAIILVIILWLGISRQKGHGLDHIPGPSYNLWMILFGAHRRTSADLHQLHIRYEDMRHKYGPIFKLTDGVQPYVVISDYDAIYQVLVTEGKEYGGRFTDYKIKEVLSNTGILFSYEANETWKTLRKISQKHLRQYGDGLSKFEHLVREVGGDMLDVFGNNEGVPFDPEQAIHDAALNTIAYLITGERSHSGDTLVGDMRKYECLFLKTFPVFGPLSFKLLHIFHWLKYLGFSRWEPYQRFASLHGNMWEKIKRISEANPDSGGICKALNNHIAKRDGLVSEADARSTVVALLLAGVTTTSCSLHGAVNILAHHQNVQHGICREVKKIMSTNGEMPKLSDRPNMPFTRAVLYEILRYTSVAAHGVKHRSVTNGTLHGYRIPAGTPVEISIWNLHHDEEFWEDPYEFRPERFLDESGDVLPADHPNRKHFMPFGAGIRVCLGESLAMARLFLWVTSLVARFEVMPAPGNQKTSTDARLFSYQGVLKATKYKIIFKERI